MFWLLHGKTRTRVVPGGQTLEDKCPACGHWSTFHEVETTTSAGAFFVDVVSAADRGFRCARCTEVLDLVDDATAATSSARSAPASARAASSRRASSPHVADTTPSRSATATPLPNPRAPRDLLSVLESEREARIIADAKRDLAVEDELAALKRKLGKK